MKPLLLVIFVVPLPCQGHSWNPRRFISFSVKHVVILSRELSNVVITNVLQLDKAPKAVSRNFCFTVGLQFGRFGVIRTVQFLCIRLCDLSVGITISWRTCLCFILLFFTFGELLYVCLYCLWGHSCDLKIPRWALRISVCMHSFLPTGMLEVRFVPKHSSPCRFFPLFVQPAYLRGVGDL